ncbi:hypothetical protein like AT3G09510 [Hibiscus trionum]|uniref:RNase H type-1 domain-containing protein n=1 Tax=Hibiscus trionum TaxID=183268 RepID=A0A9W7JI77_HIBTR|nr:hypothetical protein like AT3G09510 [Hibiscus trionum]
MKVPAKVKIHMWRVANNYLPTRSNLRVRRLEVDDNCPICQHSEEKIDHLLRDCMFSTQLFAAFSINLQNYPVDGRWLEWLASWFTTLNVKQKVLSMISYWAIWYMRNRIVHENATASIPEACAFVAAKLREFEENEPDQTLPSVTSKVKWEAPTEGVVKVNFDAAYDQASKVSFSAVVCRDNEGFILAAGIVQHQNVADAFTAEAWACLQAVRMASEVGFINIIVEGDSLTVLKKVRSHFLDNSIISPIIHDIKEAAKTIASISFGFVKREGNLVAHLLAREGRQVQCPQFWIEEAPQSIMEAAEKERPQSPY